MSRTRRGARTQSDGFILNEPANRIVGGSSRASLILKDPRFAAIRRRQRLNAVLTFHDPDSTGQEIRSTDIPLLGLAAREGIMTNYVPASRRNAILALSRWPSVENLALLNELAQLGEDFYARGHALIALGLSGVSLAAPLLVSGMRARDAYERDAAAAGLLMLARKLGPGVVRSLRHTEKNKRVRAALEKVLLRLEKARVGRRRQTSSKR